MHNTEFGFTDDLFEQANKCLKKRSRPDRLLDRYPNFPPLFGEQGAPEGQLECVESEIGHVLPSDLRWLVAHTYDPDGYLFPWVHDLSEISRFQNWVFEGIAWHIQESLDWLSAWGDRPDSAQDRLDIFTEQFELWPKLLSVLGHRAIPISPIESGNPVFSIMGTDIIYYGNSLANWIDIEFIAGPCPYNKLTRDGIRHIPIWSDFSEQTPGFLASEGLTSEDEEMVKTMITKSLRKSPNTEN